MFRKKFISYFNGSLSQTIGRKSLNGFTEVAILNCSTRIAGSQRVGRKIGLPQFMASLGLFGNELHPKTCDVTLSLMLCSVLDDSSSSSYYYYYFVILAVHGIHTTLCKQIQHVIILL